MKKAIGFLIILALAGMVAQADTYTVSVVCTNGQTDASYSAQLPISGWFEKIEVAKTGLGSNTTVLATYDGTTAIQTLYTKALVGATRAIATPRFIGTTSAGVDIAGVNGDGTNATTQLNAIYEKAVLGGNLKIGVTPTAGPATNVVTIFYSPFTR